MPRKNLFPTDAESIVVIQRLCMSEMAKEMNRTVVLTSTLVGYLEKEKRDTRDSEREGQGRTRK